MKLSTRRYLAAHALDHRFGGQAGPVSKVTASLIDRDLGRPVAEGVGLDEEAALDDAIARHQQTQEAQQ